MIRLDSTTKMLQIQLAGAVLSAELKCIVSFSDKSSAGYIGAVQTALTDGITLTTICNPPALLDSTQTVRDIDTISVVNTDTASADVTVFLFDGVAAFPVIKATLDIGERLDYSHGDGWKVLTSIGAIKTALSGVPTGSVTNVSVATANGFAGDVVNPNTTPDITIKTTVTGIVKGNGTGIVAAVPDTDYTTPSFVTSAIASAVEGLYDDRGNFSAAGGAYPASGGSGTAGAIKKGDIWTISVAGTLPTGQIVEIGDTVRALIDTPGNTQANWAIGQNNIGYVPENVANKDTVNGYLGLTAWKINFRNVANTFTSFLRNLNTAARTYTFQDRDGIIADDTDLGLKLDKSANLSDVASVSTSRTNLGLGNSATRNVGIAAGTVAAGDDVRFNSELANYGDGSDGNVTISINTTLTRTMFYDTLTVNAGVTLTTAGYKIYAKTAVINLGIIGSVGNPGGNGGNATVGAGGTSGAAGAALIVAEFLATGAGAAGGIGGAITPAAGATGVASASVNSLVNGNGGSAGAGGAGTSAGGAGLGLATNTYRPVRHFTHMFMIGNLLLTTGRGGSSGGGGGGSAAGGGGGGGGGASSPHPVVIYAPLIDNTSGIIRSNGSTGGNGGNGFGNGGGGGYGGGSCGGYVYLVYNTLIAGTIQVATGINGSPGSGAGTGANGSIVGMVQPTAGTIIKICLNDGTFN